MASAIEVEITTRTYGSDDARESCVVAFPTPTLPLSDIISLKVRAEVERELRERDANAARSRSLRYLTDETLAWARGRAKKPRRLPDIDVRAEIDRALRAFHEQRYFVVVNGARISDLTARVELTPETKIQFIRLMPLAGGQC